MKYSVVIPCYNEAGNLAPLIKRCSELIERSAQPIEVVFVNNGSNDSSGEIFSKLLPLYPGCRLVSVEVNEGYGNGIISGLQTCNSDILGWMHADLQTDPLELLTGIAEFERVGARAFVKGRRYGRRVKDVFFTIGMSVFESLLLKSRLWDINAQPVLFSRSFFASWRSPPKDFSLDLYAYYKARQAGLRVVRYPVRFGERAHGVSSWNIDWSAKKKFINRTVNFSFRLRRGVEGDGNNCSSNK